MRDRLTKKKTSIKAGNHVCKKLHYISQVPKSKSSAEEEGFWRWKTEIPQKQLTYTRQECSLKKNVLELFKKKERKKERSVCVYVFALVLAIRVFPSNEVAFPWFQYFLVDLSKTKPNIKYHFQFLLFIVQSLWQHQAKLNLFWPYENQLQVNSGYYMY